MRSFLHPYSSTLTSFCCGLVSVAFLMSDDFVLFIFLVVEVTLKILLQNFVKKLHITLQQEELLSHEGINNNRPDTRDSVKLRLVCLCEFFLN